MPVFPICRSTGRRHRSSHDCRNCELSATDRGNALPLSLAIFRFSLDYPTMQSNRHHYASKALWSEPAPLPEHIYLLDLEHPPDQRDTDPHGNLLLYTPTHGWMVTSLDEVEEAFHENGCTHWTYTPPIPPNARHHLR